MRPIGLGMQTSSPTGCGLSTSPPVTGTNGRSRHKIDLVTFTNG
jgi:hypothetical protein